MPLLDGGERAGRRLRRRGRRRRSRPPGRAGGRRRGAAPAGLDLLRDVEMEVTAELGRTRMTVRELLSLAPGAVVELDRAAGSPADLLVNGTLIARGEVVVVDEDFGIRITEIVADGAEDGDRALTAPGPRRDRATARLMLARGAVLALMWAGRRGCCGSAGGGRTARSCSTSSPASSSAATPSVAVVRVADRALVLGVTDGQVTLLAEADLAASSCDAGRSAGAPRPSGRPAGPAAGARVVLAPATWRSGAVAAPAGAPAGSAAPADRPHRLGRASSQLLAGASVARADCCRAGRRRSPPACRRRRPARAAGAARRALPPTAPGQPRSADRTRRARRGVDGRPSTALGGKPALAHDHPRASRCCRSRRRCC